MSYPAPPPPGHGGPAGQGGPNPYPPNPYAAGGNPYGQPPKKDNTLWWILGGIGVLVILCCIGVCSFALFGGAAWVADEQSSSSGTYSNSAASAEEVSVGDEVTDNDATVLSGWSITSTDDLSGVSLRNDGTSRDMLQVTFFFMKDGEVLEDATCSSTFLDPGETDFLPNCFDPISSIDDYDEIRVSEGS